MRTDFAFLCDYAQESGGKLHALGVGIDRLMVRELPATHPRLTVVARVGYSAAEAGTKRLSLRLVDADGGNVVPPTDGQVAIPAPGGASRGTMNLIVNIERPTFAAYGLYEVSVALDGNEVASLPLEVMAQQPRAG